jgi:hypothetical protein
MGHLIFVGDSYCATYNSDSHADKSDKIHDWAQVHSDYPTYLNLSAKWTERTFYSYGYGGRSWFYSRHKLLEALDSIEKLYEDTDALIFCHTDGYRMNTTDRRISTVLLFKSASGSPDFDTELHEPYLLWRTYLMDSKFQEWALGQWFKEINERFADKKMIHFNMGPWTVESSQQLKGVVYTTPLMNISLGELCGTDDEVMNQMALDRRYNHYNEHNNQAMARLIVDTLNNYEPGIRTIDLIKYDFDQPNPNAWRWPDGGYGSK